MQMSVENEVHAQYLCSHAIFFVQKKETTKYLVKTDTYIDNQGETELVLVIFLKKKVCIFLFLSSNHGPKR